MEEGETVPQYWLWVLGHLVAANRMSRIRQEKRIGDLGGIKCTNSVPLPRGLHIQDRFAAVEDLELFLNTCVFHIPHHVLKPIDEDVKDRSAGIGIWRSSNML